MPYKNLIMQNLISLFCGICLFPLSYRRRRRRRRRRRHYHGSGTNVLTAGFLVLLAGAALIYIAFKTTLVERITSNELLRTIIKIMLTVAGVGIMVFSFSLD